MISNVWNIARRDFRSYFTSPIAYVVIALFLGITGFMFSGIFGYFVKNLIQMQQYGKTPSLTEGIIRPLYGNMSVVLLMLIPLITMRTFAEEKKQHTIELLMTAPVTLTEIVLGKFLGVFLFLAIMMLLSLYYPIILYITGNPDPGVILTAALGTLLMSSCFAALGVLFSAVTENQIVAAVLTFVTCLFFWIINWAAQDAGPFWSEVLNQLSLIQHLNTFHQGTINTTDLLFYVSFIFLGLFFTHRVLDSYRWR